MKETELYHLGMLQDGKMVQQPKQGIGTKSQTATVPKWVF
jgi:hypothetical protein